MVNVIDRLKVQVLYINKWKNKDKNEIFDVWNFWRNILAKTYCYLPILTKNNMIMDLNQSVKLLSI